MSATAWIPRSERQFKRPLTMLVVIVTFQLFEQVTIPLLSMTGYFWKAGRAFPLGRLSNWKWNTE